jgi:hypothetical protein
VSLPADKLTFLAKNQYGNFYRAAFLSQATRRSVPDPETGQSVPLYHPRQQEWSMHFAWGKDATQIVGLTPTGHATVEALQMNRPRMVRLRSLWMKMGRHPTRLG